MFFNAYYSNSDTPNLFYYTQLIAINIIFENKKSLLHFLQ